MSCYQAALCLKQRRKTKGKSSVQGKKDRAELSCRALFFMEKHWILEFCFSPLLCNMLAEMMDRWLFWLGKTGAAPWKMQQKGLRGCSGYAHRLVSLCKEGRDKGLASQDQNKKWCIKGAIHDLFFNFSAKGNEAAWYAISNDFSLYQAKHSIHFSL